MKLDGKLLFHPDSLRRTVGVTTTEGVAAVREAIEFFRKMEDVPALKENQLLTVCVIEL